MRRNLMTVAVVVLAACATQKPAPEPLVTAPAKTTPRLPAEPIPALQLPKDLRATHYALELTIDPDQPGFSGVAAIDVTLGQARDVLWLHGLDLKVTSSTVTVGTESLAATWEQVNDDGVVKLSLPRAIGPGQATLHLAWTRGYDPRLVGLYLAKEAGTNYAYTQFEDIFARRAFPGFDEPGVKTPFDVTLVTPKGAVAVANTLQLSEEDAGSGRTRHRYATTRPLPTYLLAWAVGPFDVVDAPTLPPNALRSWPVPVRGIAPRGRGKELGFALKAASELLLLEEQYFGVAFAYPKLDSVAVPDYAYGAMENAGEIHYREDLLLATEGSTPEELKLEMANVIAHEQAHQWFGDLVTMPWWEDAWLNESFATWMATQMVQTWKPAWNSAIDLQKSSNRAMGNDSLATARAIRQPLTSVKNIQDQFDTLTYEKGGAVLSMFEKFVGVETFRQGVSAYISAHANGSGSTDDLLAALSKAAGRDLIAPFHTFLDQAGVPLIRARVSCSAGKGSLALEQSRFLPLGTTATQDRTWQVPLCVKVSVGGKLSTQCTLLTGASATLALPGCPDWVMPNAEAAGYYRWSLVGEDLKKLRTAGYAKLSTPERIALAENLKSAVQSNALPFGEALDALEPIANDADGEVALEAVGLLNRARDVLLPADEAARVDAYASQLFTPALKRLGYAAKKGEPTASRRFRGAVLNLLAWAQDPAVVKELTRLGLAYAGLADGAFHPEAVDPDVAGIALAVAVEHGDARIFDALATRLEKLDDADLRGRVLIALSAVKDPARSAKVLALSASPTLRKQESVLPVFVQSEDPRTRDAAWAFTKANYKVIAANMPEVQIGFVPMLAAGYCDGAHADELTTFFDPIAPKQAGMAKVVRQVAESVRLCDAQAQAQRESARAFFKTRMAKARAPSAK
jgi:alanyl aminopeptidase